MDHGFAHFDTGRVAIEQQAADVITREVVRILWVNTAATF